MALISFTIANENLPRFLDAQAFKFGYRETIDGQPNPETKAAFVRRMQRGEWVRDVERYESRAAAAVAAQIAAEKVRTEVSIT